MPNREYPDTMGTTLTEATDEDELSLEQRLWNISQASKGGCVRGHIRECELTNNDTICVHVQLPNGEMHTQTFPMPKTDSPEYAFVRLVEDCGYSLASAGQLAGDDGTDGARVWCEPIDASERTIDPEPHNEPQADTDQSGNDDWRLVVPEYTPPLGQRLRARLDTIDFSQIMTTLAIGGGFLLLPLFVPIILVRIANDDSIDLGLTVILAALGLLLWSTGIWLLYISVIGPVVDMPTVKVLF